MPVFDQQALAQHFGAALARLLPPHLPPRLALAVSGGADSTALVLLAHAYCTARGGEVRAFIVDHGLRLDSAQEAQLTAARLHQQAIPSQILTLRLEPGPALQARARVARYQALAQAAQVAGFVYLALGHHQADQYETVAMRAAHGPGGGEGMAAWSAREQIVLLRPLLSFSPDLFRSFLQARGMEWVEDPSNQLRRFERVRIRQDQLGHPPRNAAVRVAQEQEDAAFLARHAVLSPYGYVLLEGDSCPSSVLARLLRTVGGRLYPPRQAAVQRLAAKLQPATLGGVRLTPAGRLGGRWLLVREPALCAPPVLAQVNARWDERFTLLHTLPHAVTCGALGADARLFRGTNGLPSVVLQGLAGLRDTQGRVLGLAETCFIPPLPLLPRLFQS